MKFFTASAAITVNQLVISSLLSMPASVEAVKCGQWYSTECKAKTDVRSYEVGGGINGLTTTQTFTNKAKTTAALTVDTWNKANDVAILFGTRRGTYEKITEEEFLSEIVRQWDENQIKADERPLPSAGPCLSSICATEENWCKFDPNCSVSPYQEPEGKLKNSFVAGLISICALVIFLVAYVYHRKLVSDEAKRVRILVATRIAEHLNVTFNSKKLTKEALSQQFQSIDSSGDGVLQKDEIKEFFMDSKHGGSITESDFESIFAALDSDGNGKIDFVEFVAFLNQCKSDTFGDENDA